MPTDGDERARGPQRARLCEESFEAVLAAARADAGWAFERLFDAHAPLVSAYLGRQGVEDPDGLANEVMFAAFRRVNGFSGGQDAFRSWVFTIAHNRLIDERRRRQRRPVAEPVAEPEAEGGPAGDVERDAFALLEAQEVDALLDTLSREQRDVLLLRIVADLTVGQVAAALDKTPGAVKALQRRGLAALRRSLDSRRPDAERFQGVPL